MPYSPKNFESLLGTPGFSDLLLKNHFTLYQGYVTNVNKLSDELSTLARDGKMSTPQYAELKRRFGWEFNGMRLHEYYFGNMKSGGSPLDKFYIAAKISENFGSLENWEKDFRATGAMRGIGWTILYDDPIGNRLFNAWVTEHDMGHLAGAKPLLVLDVFEHAYISDYGLKKADYIEAFMKAIDWEIVCGRFDNCNLRKEN